MTVFRGFPTFSRAWIFFLLRLSLFDLLSSSLLFSSLTFSDSSHLCFSSVHIVRSLTSKLASTTTRYTTLITPQQATTTNASTTTTTLHNTTLHHTDYIALHYNYNCSCNCNYHDITLHYTTLHHATLHYIILYYTTRDGFPMADREQPLNNLRTG